MVIYLSIFVAFLGAGAFWASKNSKLAELGRLAFATGLLAFLLSFSRDVVARLAH
jgi:Na+/phosphate symporter